jgi:di/tricarboxylate transporter
MSADQSLILGILVITVAMFLWGRWRHDMVAMAALLACVVGGLVAPAEAFSGFGHPAVVTVACVLVLSRALQVSGAVDVLTRKVLPAGAGSSLSIAALAVLAALLSGFMNNVGALALLMPVAIQIAARLELPPGKVLMPLAFASILGGTTTLIGTPPNLIVSGFRAAESGSGFAMFDFAFVGAPLALAGVLFIAVLGWRLVPRREHAGAEGFDPGAYFTEARVPAGSKADGLRLREIENELDEADAQIVGLVREDERMTAPNGMRVVRAGDILIIEAEAEGLAEALSRLGLTLEEAVDPAESGEDAEESEEGEEARSDEIRLMELVVRQESGLVGRSASDIQLRARYGINLLAVSRDGRSSRARLRSLRLRQGDVLLMQGVPETVMEFAADFGCIPLASRELRIPDRRKAIVSSAIMLVAVLVAAFGWLPAAVSFAGGVLATMIFRTVSPTQVYHAVDWPVVVLLAALLPVAGAMQTTGAADLVARLLLDSIARGDAVIGLVVILVTTMVLTDMMNNAATAAVMAPIALGAALQLGVNPDTFLMAVALGASCAFLTPIGHQNNTLVLGPGGFRFGDYWPMGLPLDIIVVALGVPLLLMTWPLSG